MSKKPTLSLLALGANLPHGGQGPELTLRRALTDLVRVGGRLRAVSRFFRTPAFPAGAGPDYVNAAATFETDLSPRALLDHLHGIEAQYGRERVQRWGQRTLDLDLLAYGDLICPDLDTFGGWRDLGSAEQTLHAPQELILPHPRLQDRGFVLVPLADIAPDWQHPVSGLRVRDMCAALPDAARAEVVPI